jgi:hypothetical protein
MALMTRVQFDAYLRSLLGRQFSVADEEHGVDSALRLVVLRRGADHALIVETADPWVRALQTPPSREDRMLLKHLGICIRRYFAARDALAARSFVWPGTSESRSRVRAALDPRRRRRSYRQQEE